MADFSKSSNSSSSSSSSIHGKQQSLTNDSGAAERMRIEHLKQERERQEKEKARIALGDKKRLLDQHHLDSKRREFELNRLKSEVVRNKAEVDTLKRQFNDGDGKFASKKLEAADLAKKVQKMQLELLQAKNQLDKINAEIAHEGNGHEYKRKLLENKEEALRQAEERVKREAFELQRVHGETIRLESEAKALDQKAR